MNIVFIVPTGIGAEIGGHSGDATPAAKLIASACDKLFIHPNVVNASDINEMTENMLYVEGSILDRFLEGDIGLKETKGNKILLVVNDVEPHIVNAASAARATIGADISILKLNVPLEMEGYVVSGKADGCINNIEAAIEQIGSHRYDKFDVIVVNTAIKVAEDDVLEYLSKNGGVNLWGFVEARMSRELTRRLERPVFHAPIESGSLFRTFNKIVDPRKAAELVSVCYLHCCLKGAHVTPKIISLMQRPCAHLSNVLSYLDVDFLVTPAGAYGRPHAACLEARIPVIVVEENFTVLNDRMPGSFIVARNYLEAAGIIVARKAGVTLDSIRRPLKDTVIL
ncbi:hypothetical protein LCGC14_0542000 [marine sediment metagenome]|uniref:DUF3326 domain-containing protein n=1 Tax=marine sediment metagenome TaxID=412755 RepID=A0A0F9V0V5_9ZZZZ